MREEKSKIGKLEKSVKNILLLCAALGLLFCAGLFLWFISGTGIPKEASILQNFQAHQAVFEQLRDMLQTDEGLRRVASWGVETRDGIFSPPDGHFPAERFAKYLALLKEAHLKGAYRVDGAHPSVGMLVWTSGFGGDSVHINICWEKDPPSRQISSFDAFLRDHKSTGTTGWVNQHLDGNWYLSTDLQTE